VSERPARVLAVLDTSFWVLAYRAEIAANCLDLFDIVVPTAVADEILAREAGLATREYPYATLFRHLQHELRRSEVEVERVGLFGRGEAEAIALAAKLGAVLLINERPGAHYAQNMGLDVATVPAVIVLLRAQGVISDNAARQKLKLIAANTAPQIVQQATRALDALVTSRPSHGGSGI
jgi:predicted nucleic acid-binding protein